MSEGPTERPARGAATWGLPRTVATILGIALAGALLVGGTGLAAVQPVLQRQGPGVAADGSIDGLQTFDDLTNMHVDRPVDYDPFPPVGGDHLSAWQNCGFYDAPIITEAGVHSLEHGAVWVTYDPDLPAEQVERLRRLAEVNPYLLVSPVRGLPGPVVASAWGVQVRLRSADDVRLEAFLLAYLQGPQNPEPGAPCSGGLAGTAAQESQV